MSKKGAIRLIERAKQKTLWKRVRDTSFGYWFRRTVLWMMGIPETAALRDLLLEEREPILKMQYPGENASRYSVLLLQLPLPSNRRHKRIIPLGIAYIASYLLKEMPEVNVGILDAQCQSLTYHRIIKAIARDKWDIVGFSYWTVQAQYAENLSHAIRSMSPQTIIVHGGVHPTLQPEDALKSADYCMRFEGEQSFAELVQALSKGKPVKDIAGVAYKEDEKVVANPPRPLLKNIDQLPFPAYHLLPIEEYNMPLHVVGGERMPIVGSRGCPYECSFCASPILWQKKVRFRSAQDIIDEMKMVIDRYGIKKFHFWDDNFTINRRYVKEVCRLIIDEKLRIQWVCLDRAEHINRNRDLLPLMREAGCIGVEIGLESANPDTFIHIHKNQAIEASREAIKNLKAAELKPLYTCMAFNPGETIVGYYLQKEFLDSAQEGYQWFDYFHPFPYPLYIGQFATAYPGTRFFEEIDELCLQLIEDVEDRYHHRINSIPYSLLNDIPLRTVRRLNEEHYFIFLDAVRTGFWTVFPGNSSQEELATKLYDVWRFLYPFFKKCDGSLTVRQIALHLSEYLNIPLTKSLRLTAYAVYIFAQLGLLRSAIYYTDYPIKEKDVRVPPARKREILHYLSIVRITRRNLLSDIRRR